MSKNIPEYYTPPDTYCPEYGELCQVVPLRNEFDYAGTHWPFNWGESVSDCCEAPIEEIDT